MKNHKTFLYPFAKYPKNKSTVDNITKACARLEVILRKVDVNKIHISDYNKRYFGNYIKDENTRRLNLMKYGFILSWALENINMKKEEISFVDHGAGNGMLSLLAKEYGIGNVIYNDIYEVSTNDAKKIAKSINLLADHYITGEIDDIVSYCRKNDITVDSLANFDVIEHIYDIDDFLSKINNLTNGPLSIFMASTANKKNPWITRRIRKMHNEFEYQDREFKYGRKPTDATRALYELRKEIIKEYDNSLTDIEIENLSFSSRGLMKKDIIKMIDKYKSDYFLPLPINDPTNTCDPNTGNWFENLIDPEYFLKRLNEIGMKSRIICGFYDSPNKISIKLIKFFMNILIRTLGKAGLKFSPFYAISALKKN